MLNRLFIVVVLFCATQYSYAQYKFSSDPAAFVVDVNTMMANTKNPAAIQAGTTFGSTLTSLSVEQQKKLITLIQKIGKSKKVRSHPNFTDFFSALNAAKTNNISTNNLDSLIIITDELTEKYDGKVLQAFMTFIKGFYENNLLYGSAYNRLRISGGSYSFRLAESKSPIEEMIEEPTETKNPEPVEEENFFSDWDTPVEESPENFEEPPVEETNVLDVGYNYPMQPSLDGPIIEFKNVDLCFATQNDSSVLKNTSGSLLLKDYTFIGKGGTMDWTTAGVPAGEIVAEMREYNFPVKSIRLLSEGAVLSYKSKADSLVEGIFEYKENKSKAKFEAQYPRFKSFNSNIKVKGLDQNIIYKGGLSLSGKKIYSSSVDDGFSMIEIHKDGVTKVKAFSNRFELGDSLIVADYATMTLYMDYDSITHPGTHFKYNKNASYLRIAKKEGFNYAPFIDSYHRLEIISDVVTWDLNKKTIDFNIINAKNHIPATFESDEFFHADKYFKLKGAYRFHPLQVIVAHADKNRIEDFYAGDVAVPLKIDLNTFKGAMIQLMKLGYIDYNPKSGLIHLRPKARHYTLSSRNKKDYDNINFISLSPGAINASLDLETHELFVRGVDRIYISDSLKVNFAPANKEIKIQKNRNFKFDGIINTENFQFIGKEFEFVYDTFLVHLHEIDEIKLAVVKKKKGAKTDTTTSKSRVLGNELRYSSGTLYINKPDNKSARKKIPQYPIFDATTGATVFFDKKGINGGAYDTSVQFVIPPFRLDSLSSDDPHSIGFDGTFKSGGIFPEFKEKLVVMPDYSLGFSHTVPKKGYQLYEGDAKYYNVITLDNKGVRGDGEIRYLSTTLWSNNFVFYKDSMKTEGTEVNMKEGTHADAKDGVTYPKMKVNNYRAIWYPKLDSMFISNIKTPIAFYDSTATMIGTTNLTKAGLLGRGVLFTRGSISESFKFKFEQKDFVARNAKFRIESDDPDKPALLGNDVKLNFDLEKSLAHFSPEVEGFASNSFPYVQYKSSLQEGEWDLQKKVVTLAMPDSADIRKSYFYSTRPDQDSLVYNATKGVYDIPKQILNISGIPYIDVVDAHIFPDSGKVTIQQNAVMKTLEKAVIEVDTIKKYHHLYDGKIDILSRNKFEGEATYRYINLGDDTLAILFQDFRSELGHKKKEGMHTVATGLVKPDDSLTIGPKIIYKGKVTMFAESPYLVFDGFVKLDLKGALSYSEWLKYSNNGEDKHVKIDLQNAISDNGVPLTTGLHLDRRSNQLYTSFISKKYDQRDHNFLVADKFFDYDIDSNEFLVGNLDRFAGKTYVGNNMRYNDSTSILNFAGNFTLLEVLEKGGNIKLISTGSGYADLTKSDYNFNTLLGFNIPLNPKISLAIGKNLQSVATEENSNATIPTAPSDSLSNTSDSLSTPAPSIDNSNNTVVDETYNPKANDLLFGKIAAYAGQNGLDNYRTKLSLGVATINGTNKELAKSFTFSNVNLKWSTEYKSFYSVGKIEVAGILKTEITKTINGFIEIRKSNKGDVINIYLEPEPGHWYYISYNDNRLSCISSKDDLNQIIRGKSKGEMPDRSKFYFVAAEPIEKQKFLNEFKTHYLNITEDQLSQEPVIEEKKKEPITIDSTNNTSNPEIKNESPAPKEETAPPVPTTVKKKKKKEQSYDQYKLPDQEDDKPVEEQPVEKEKPTIEDQQQKQIDQQKMKDLFK